MAKFKVGDKIRIKTSKNTGVIKLIYPSDYWNMTEDEYAIELDDGSGVMTIVERVLELRDGPVKCTCGLKYAPSGGKHSSWCDLYDKND